MTEREDKHRPKTKAEKKLEHHEHKMKVSVKFSMNYSTGASHCLPIVETSKG